MNRYWSIKAKPGKTVELAAALKALVARANEVNDGNLRAYREVVGDSLQFHMVSEAPDANGLFVNAAKAHDDEEFRQLSAAAFDLVEGSRNALLEKL